MKSQSGHRQTYMARNLSHPLQLAKNTDQLYRVRMMPNKRSIALHFTQGLKQHVLVILIRWKYNSGHMYQDK